MMCDLQLYCFPNKIVKSTELTSESLIEPAALDRREKEILISPTPIDIIGS